MTNTGQSGAAEHWRQQLEAWALPPDLLAQSEASPYEWQKELWKRRGEHALASGAATPTSELVSKLAGEGGSVVDIGAGTGRASFPLRSRGHTVTMVEPSPTMVASLQELAAGVDVTLVRGRWPDVEESVSPHDVAMAAHVVYDVAEVVPFLEAMERKARQAVVFEMTPTHPWTSLAPLYQEFHGLDRPRGPTTEDFAAVARELGRDPAIERWIRSTDMVFESIEEIVAVTGRRLVLPQARWPELETRIRENVSGEAGAYFFEPRQREITTVWWRTGNSL